MKFVPLALVAVAITAAATAPSSALFDDKDFQVDLVVAMTNHDRSYCYGPVDAAISDLKALISVYETKLRKGRLTDTDARFIHGELVGIYGRLASVYKKAGLSELSNHAVSSAIENWHQSDKEMNASTPRQVWKLVQDIDQREPCKRP